MKQLSLICIAFITLVLSACNQQYPNLEDGLYAEIKTNKGTALAELFYKDVPMTVANFVSLAEGENTMVDSSHQGKKFYDGIIFHRVIKDFMIQTGDPLGTGTGDAGYKFPDEIVDSLKHDTKGVLSMANSGPNTNGSQFFITLKETPWLDGRHTIFGQIVEGQEVIDSIGAVKTVAADKPEDTISIETITIVRKGQAAKNFDASKIFASSLEESKRAEEEKERLANEAKEKNAKKFEELKAKATEDKSGIKIVMLEEGDGPKPKSTDMVGVYYAGYLTDGTLFDTNMEDLAETTGQFNEQRKIQGGYDPMNVPYSPDAQMIPGFKNGLLKLDVGDHAVIFIPAHLAYGERGAGNVIPPNSDLIFEIKLDGIAEAPQQEAAPAGDTQE